MEMKRWRSNDYMGQTKIEFEKNYKRVRDIVSKSEGDQEKQNKLAKLQADKITSSSERSLLEDYELLISDDLKHNSKTPFRVSK